MFRMIGAAIALLAVGACSSTPKDIYPQFPGNLGRLGGVVVQMVEIHSVPEGMACTVPGARPVETNPHQYYVPALPKHFTASCTDADGRVFTRGVASMLHEKNWRQYKTTKQVTGAIFGGIGGLVGASMQKAPISFYSYPFVVHVPSDTIFENEAARLDEADAARARWDQAVQRYRQFCVEKTSEDNCSKPRNADFWTRLRLIDLLAFDAAAQAELDALNAAEAERERKADEGNDDWASEHEDF